MKLTLLKYDSINNIFIIVFGIKQLNKLW